ncbi:MAG: protein phosphatase 2C domain-containing protein [Chloroflexi bacterium]|nr:protein phosphatase 2C domain-containing protein [Chloroflexota bacterium]
MKRFFEKLFKLRPPLEVDVPTRPTRRESASELGAALGSPAEPPQLVVACAQSVGKQRDHNEDALFTLNTTLTGQDSVVPFGLFIVADGMGGHQHGEVASGIAVRAMASHIVRKLYTPLLNTKPTSPEDSLLEIMQAGVQDAHKAITRQAPGGGTTLTAALIVGRQLAIAHVGDSRAYLIEADQNGGFNPIEALTRDHSLVRRLVELGQISTAEAAVHPQRNVLYRALGQGEPFDPDVNSMQAPDAGYLLLCSDGLWGVVPEADMQRAILAAANPEEACQTLIQAANNAGGPDNISAILVRLPG